MKADYSESTADSTLSEPNSIEPSIQEKILAEMLDSLKGYREFPPELVEQIKRLDERGQLQKATEVMKLIKSSIGVSYEAD